MFWLVEQVLRLGDCGSSDWRFYADSKEYVSGLVQGAVDSSSMKIAVWQSSKDIYKPRANVKLLSRAFAAFKNDYGAAWIKKPTNARSVNLRRLRALIDRNYLRSGNHNQCHTTCTNLRNKRIHQITTFLYWFVDVSAVNVNNTVNKSCILINFCSLSVAVSTCMFIPKK